MIDRTLEKLFNFSHTSKRIIQILTDCVLITFSFAAAMALRLDGFGFAFSLKAWEVLIVIVPVSILIFVRLGFYRAVIRYITSKAFEVIVTGVVVSSLTMYLVSQFLSLPVPRSVPLIYGLMMLVTVGGARFGLHALFLWRKDRSKDNVLIYGAGEAGRQLCNILNQGSEYAPVAFLDNAKDLQGREVNGLTVHPSSDIEQLIDSYNVSTVLLALPSASRSMRRGIVNRLEELSVEVKTIPSMTDIISGKAQISDLRTVSVDELLGRDLVPPREDLMATNIAGKVVLVTGAGGSIGSELCRQIFRQKPLTLILLDVSEFALYKVDNELQACVPDKNVPTRIIPVLGSVQNSGRISAILKAFGVQTIYHAAAYKHVPLVEQNVVEGLRNNVFGTQIIAKAAIAAGVEAFTLVSTDKAVRPTNIMGASKRMAELICESFAREQSKTVFSMVRFGNVLGSSGSVIPRFREQIERGGPVTITHPDITRFFMTIPEAAQLVIQAGAMAKGGDVFILDMGESVKIVDLAQRMIRLHGLMPFFADNQSAERHQGDIEISFTGLRQGEKLYEELLISNNPAGTEHPRIMTATKVLIQRSELDGILEELFKASQAYDIETIRQILIGAPTGYQPGDKISDIIWNEKDEGLDSIADISPAAQPHIRIVNAEGADNDFVEIHT
ncbi:MAG: polysaccharide biosynthesis protein [Alphaproteobacteria bacterium]|nr:polysaccharide biosynthesis protein [Alphaproteobacteria bacterium]